MLRSWILFLLVVIVPATAAADSLVAAARRERERRAKISKSAGKPQVMTNKSLSHASTGTLNQAPGSRQASSSATNAKKGTSEDKWGEWKKRFADAREAIDDAEADLTAAQARAGILRRGLTYGDPQDFNQKSQTDQALAVRSNAETALKNAKKALTDLGEEARRAGVPASVRR